ncbi:hypothetical protein I5Q34_19795 [Streptomyces sp. AV19]|uniref:hypothetical protein n=1 Tax=Streptomyces sp. AV19 TaxID=2793068 RepID=UPI0018FEA9C5|nr:hypothetical protein [Streptomyces sp. AV19]MBH1936492.1 hypothetical protein [Streptomyces sp. AV19]MDG4532549.1 hypothetical protein [Streptomyces sp. AV19]
MIVFVQEHASRIYTIAVAVVYLVAYFVHGLPDELILTLVAALLGVGEAVQRTANARVRAAAGINEHQGEALR